MSVFLMKKRMEKKMESQAAAVEAEVDHLVNQKIPEAARSAIKEAAEIKAHFSQLSEHALFLTKENSSLRAQNSQLKVDVDNLEQMLVEMCRQSCISKKVGDLPSRSGFSNK